MLEGKSIVCFSNDWENDPTSKHHVMRILSAKNKVLWINSIGMRRPTLSSSDIKRVITKLRGWSKGLTKVNDNLHHFTPIVLPLAGSRVGRAMNRILLRLSIRYFCRKLGMDKVQLWTFLPNISDMIGSLNEELLVYYCVDEWSKFSFMDGEILRAQEILLMQHADLVITTADHLYRDKEKFNANTHLLTHGVDQAFFATSLLKETAIAPELAAMKGPLIGFFGLIHEWIDCDLIAHIAQARPDWNLVLIGKIAVPVDELRGLGNVHLLGQRPYGELVSFCKGFAVGLIPFKVNELTINVNPIKMREYLAAGLPVVATALPEVEKYHDHVAIARSKEEMVDLIAREVEQDNFDKRLHRSREMEKETWDSKVETLSQLVMAVGNSR